PPTMSPMMADAITVSSIVSTRTHAELPSFCQLWASRINALVPPRAPTCLGRGITATEVVIASGWARPPDVHLERAALEVERIKTLEMLRCCVTGVLFCASSPMVNGRWSPPRGVIDGAMTAVHPCQRRTSPLLTRLGLGGLGSLAKSKPLISQDS